MYPSSMAMISEASLYPWESRILHHSTSPQVFSLKKNGSNWAFSIVVFPHVIIPLSNVFTHGPRKFWSMPFPNFLSHNSLPLISVLMIQAYLNLFGFAKTSPPIKIP
jgi:hypothetical protein